MSSSAAFRHARHLCTAAASTATTPAITTISKARAKLRSEHDPDKSLEIYSSVSSRFSSPTSCRYAQDITVRRLAKSGRINDIETLLEAHKRDPKIKEETFVATLIRSYGVAGMHENALKTYNQMEELGTKRSSLSFNALMSAYNQSKQFDQVPKLFDEMPQMYGFVPDKVSYGILIKSYCGSGNPERAIEIMREMEEKEVEITTITLTTILSGLYKQGKSEEADKIWDEMVKKGCLPDVPAYNVRMMNLPGGGDPEEIKAFIEEMKGAGLKPDTITYNYLINCYYKVDMLEEAKVVYEELEKNGCKPNAATFRTMIYYLCRNEDFEKGYKVFRESAQVHRIPDFNTLQHLVRGLVKKSRTKDAKGLSRTVKKNFSGGALGAWRKLEEELGLLPAAVMHKKLVSEVFKRIWHRMLLSIFHRHPVCMMSI